MTTDEALRLGFIVAGPILSVAGLFFAIAISASPYHNLVGKALAWPLSPMAGLVSGAHYGGTLLPGWEAWGVAWFYGPGFFAVWMIAGALTHDDVTHVYGVGFKRLSSLIARRLRERSTGAAPNGKVYKARAGRHPRNRGRG